MSAALILETLNDVADLLRKTVEGETIIDSKRVAVLLADIEACLQTFTKQWEKN